MAAVGSIRLDLIESWRFSMFCVHNLDGLNSALRVNSRYCFGMQALDSGAGFS